MTSRSPATAEASRAPLDPPGPADELTYPTKRDEAWRYAPHRDLATVTFGPSPTTTIDLPAAVAAQIPELDGPRLVMINGVVDETRSDLTDLQHGLLVVPLAAAVDGDPDAVAGHFAPDPSGPPDAFVALNKAYGHDGAFVRVDEGCRVERPIHLVDVSVPDGAQHGTCAGVVISLGERSAATVVETHVGAPGTGGSNTRSTITLGAGASLDHLVLQDLPAEQIQLDRLEVHQAAGSAFRARSFNLGARYGRIDYHVRLAGEDAVADLAGLYFGFGDQTLDQQITIVHAAENCTSRQSFRGVLDDRSVGVFSGGIEVSPGADGTDAEQANDNLLLSTQAEVNTQPRLEILADDVACKHGATVGQLDETALYYLRSRGIPASEARQLLIAGFADQTVDEIEFEAVRAWVTARLGHGHA